MTRLLEYKSYILGVLVLASIGYFIFQNKPRVELGADIQSSFSGFEDRINWHKITDSLKQADIQSSFEPNVYYAQIVQVGGIGSDVHTSKAWYLDDGLGKGDEQDNYINEHALNKEIYAKARFNIDNSLVSLWCKDKRYTASVPKKDTIHFYDSSKNLPAQDLIIENIIENKGELDPVWGYGIALEDTLNNKIEIRCEKI